MARKGAEHRYAELKEELALLVKHFPHVASKAGAPVAHGATALSKGGQAKMKELTPRKRKTMSAAAKKAVSLRMKKYWAAKRKAGDKK
jgi:hypothetical protein